MRANLMRHYPFSRQDALACVLLATLVFACACALGLWHAVGFFHDDAIYLITARALAEGDGYRLVSLPGSPPQTKYPFLFPALLAAVWKLWPAFPDNLVPLKAVSLACAMAFFPLVYLYLVRFGYATRSAAFFACALCASATHVIYFTTSVMAEMLFGVLLVAALWRVEWACRQPSPGWRADLLTGVLLALPFLCRSVGLVVPVVSGWLLYRAGRSVPRVLGTTALTLLPWFAWTTRSWLHWHADPVTGYYTDYVGWWLGFGLTDLARVVLFNALCILNGIIALGLEGVHGPAERLHMPFAILLTIIPSLIGVFVLLRQAFQGRVLALTLTAYLLVVVAWPWHPARFLLPVLPLLVAYLLTGLGELVRHRVPSRLALAAGVALVALNLVHLLGEIRATREGTSECVDAIPVVWECRLEVFHWVRTHTRADDVLASGSDQMLALFTRRQAFYPIVCSPQSFVYGQTSLAPHHDLEGSLGSLRHHRPRYLIVMPGCHGELDFRAWVAALVRAYPEQVKEVWQGSDPRFTIYEIHYPLTPR